MNVFLFLRQLGERVEERETSLQQQTKQIAELNATIQSNTLKAENFAESLA
jgi:uncharacterized coiled-coil protein SlyX